MNRKVKSFKQTVFLTEQCAVSKVTTSQVFKVQTFGLDIGHNFFATRLLPCQFF